MSSCLLFYLSPFLPVYLSTWHFVYLSTCHLCYLSSCLLFYLSPLTYLLSCLSYLSSFYQTTCLPVFMSTCVDLTLICLLVPVYFPTCLNFLPANKSPVRQLPACCTCRLAVLLTCLLSVNLLPVHLSVFYLSICLPEALLLDKEDFLSERRRRTWPVLRTPHPRFRSNILQTTLMIFPCLLWIKYHSSVKKDPYTNRN